jgi:hypothetical protein
MFEKCIMCTFIAIEKVGTVPKNILNFILSVCQMKNTTKKKFHLFFEIIYFQPKT